MSGTRVTDGSTRWVLARLGDRWVVLSMAAYQTMSVRAADNKQWVPRVLRTLAAQAVKGAVCERRGNACAALRSAPALRPLTHVICHSCFGRPKERTDPVPLRSPITCRTLEDCLAVDGAVWSEHVRMLRERARSKMLNVADDDSGGQLHWRLFAEVVDLDPRDWSPYGLLDRDHPDVSGADCSVGCKHYLTLPGELGFDWGVCTNPASHRVGRLTFEHQGCLAFEREDVKHRRTCRCLSSFELGAESKRSRAQIIDRLRSEAALPTVLREGPYRIYFFSHETSEPPHVHVDRDDSTAKFWINRLACRIILASELMS